MTKFKVLRDTREQKGFGWVWPESDLCAGTISDTLITGDYSLVGFHHIFAIERKRGTGELAMNFFSENFEEELERAKELRHFWVLIECPFDDLFTFPANSGIPKNRWANLRITPKLLLKRFVELQMKYPHVHFLFVGHRGKDVASSIFKRMIEQYADKEGKPTVPIPDTAKRTVRQRLAESGRHVAT